MLDFSHIFKGNTPSDQRRFVGEAIAHLKDRIGRIIKPADPSHDEDPERWDGMSRGEAQ